MVLDNLQPAISLIKYILAMLWLKEHDFLEIALENLDTEFCNCFVKKLNKLIEILNCAAKFSAGNNVGQLKLENKENIKILQNYLLELKK